jgi:hypothetical protein
MSSHHEGDNAFRKGTALAASFSSESLPTTSTVDHHESVLDACIDPHQSYRVPLQKEDVMAEPLRFLFNSLRPDRA